jgi:hypothetical protein
VITERDMQLVYIGKASAVESLPPNPGSLIGRYSTSFQCHNAEERDSMSILARRLGRNTI